MRQTMRTAACRLFLAAATLFPLVASATTACTWAINTALPIYAASAVTGTCSADAGTAPSGANDGISLAGLNGITVHVEAVGAMTPGTIAAYGYNPISRNWNPIPELNLTVTAVAAQAFPGLVVTSGVSRIAYVPSGLGQALTIYIIGTYRSR